VSGVSGRHPCHLSSVWHVLRLPNDGFQGVIWFELTANSSHNNTCGKKTLCLTTFFFVFFLPLDFRACPYIFFKAMLQCFSFKHVHYFFIAICFISNNLRNLIFFSISSFFNFSHLSNLVFILFIVIFCFFTLPLIYFIFQYHPLLFYFI